MYDRASKKRKQSMPGSAGLEEYRRMYTGQILADAGVSRGRHLDPVYQLTNTFRCEFDAVGRQRSAEMAEVGSAQHENPRKGEDPEPESRERLSAGELRRRHDSPVYSHSATELRSGEFLDRFTSHAFGNGALAASVMAGKGKMMLTTCFRRAGIAAPTGSERQKKLIGGRYHDIGILNQPASIRFGKEAQTAVGIVVDAVRGAGRTLEIFRQLAEDDAAHSQNRLEKHGINTMHDLYPFLRLEDDKRLIAEYRSQREALGNDTTPAGLMKRKALESAEKKAESVLERKMAEQRKFLSVLDRISANVKEAEEMFTADGFTERLLEELDKVPDTPPEDNKKRRTLEDTDLGDILDALRGDEPAEKEKADGREDKASDEKASPGKQGEKQA